MSEAGPSLDNFDDEQDSNRFTIQPYQFEPRINSDEAGSLSGEESMESDEEAANFILVCSVVLSDRFIVLTRMTLV